MAKVRLQWKGDASAGAPVYNGALDVMYKTLRSEGITGLYTGKKHYFTMMCVHCAYM